MKGCQVPTANVDGGSAISTTLKRAPGPISPTVWRAPCAADTRSRIAAADGTSVHNRREPKARCSVSRTSAATPNSRRWIGAKSRAESWMFTTSTRA